jgi:hypothetical protein
MTRLVPVALVVLLACSHCATAAGPFDDLLKAVPPNTNTLALVNVKAAFDSPLAKKENWALQHQQKYRSGLGFVPADASMVVIASDVNLSVLTRGHQVALVKVRNTPTIPELAAREGGTSDTITGQSVVLSPRDVYYAPLPGGVLAGVFPADRQATARWLRHTQSAKGPALSPYLQKAADAAGDAAVVIAVDLGDVVTPSILKYGLSNSPVVAKRKGLNVDVLVRVVSSVRGLTLAVKITDTVTGTIRVEFGQDPTLFRNTMKDLFLELVDDMGAAIPGLETWEATFDATSMTLSGGLTTPDLQRILSLFAFPGAAGEDDAKAAKDEVSVGATQRYVAAVTAILDNIKKAKDSPQYEKTATWHDKAAAQLEQLNRRGVDPLAVEAALESAKRLHAIAASMRGVPIDMEALARKGYYYNHTSIGWSVGWWGGVRPVYMPGPVETNYPQIMAEQAKVIAADKQRRSDAWSQIDSLLLRARDELTTKYKAKF